MNTIENIPEHHRLIFLIHIFAAPPSVSSFSSILLISSHRIFIQINTKLIRMGQYVSMNNHERDSAVSYSNQVRFSTLAEAKNITNLQIYYEIMRLSFISFGTQIHQIEIFRRRFVREKGWLNMKEFKEIRDLCWALPGPTVVQFLVSMAMLITKEPLTGMLSFIIFSIPSLFFLTICGWLVSVYVNPATEFPVQITLLFLGFLVSSTALITNSFIENFKQLYNSPAKLIIICSSALIFLQFQSINSISFCLIVGAVISLYMQIQTKKQMAKQSKDLFDQNFNWFFGKNAIMVLVGIYIGLWVLFTFVPDSQFIYTEVFYFVGCFIIGPINTIFAYFYGNFIELDLMSETQFWIGVPFAFLLPGSILNIGIYFGALIDGFRGTILSALFLYLPCFLSLCGILPEWEKYRNRPGIQRLVIGMNCVTTGFTFSFIVLALKHALQIDVSITICTYIVSLFLSQVWGVYTFIIVLLGGFLANMRRWGLIYYRLLPDQVYS